VSLCGLTFSIEGVLDGVLDGVFDGVFEDPLKGVAVLGLEGAGLAPESLNF